MTTTAQPTATSRFRTVRALLGLYAGVGAVALAAAALLGRSHPEQVNSEVWTRGVVVVVSGMVLAAFANRAQAGSRAAYRRLRIVSAVTVGVLALIVALPGLPLWMRADQAAAGLLMVAVAVLVHSRRARALFPAGSDTIDR
jgi:undecaprenyl pyrophosphate phosphatase UppP